MSICLAGKDTSLEPTHFHECFVVVVAVGVLVYLRNAEDIGYIPQQGMLAGKLKLANDNVGLFDYNSYITKF